jgi:hypothetical protein
MWRPRVGYRCVDCWLVSMASPESAVRMGLEFVGWSMRVLGPRWVFCVVLTDVCSDSVCSLGLREGSGGGLCVVLRIKNVYWSCTVGVVQ